jgi:hypothetical protein
VTVVEVDKGVNGHFTQALSRHQEAVNTNNLAGGAAGFD